MPIHDQGYRRYRGRQNGRTSTWWVIARAGIAARVRQRRLLALLMLAWSLFAVRAVQIYLAANFGEASFLAPDLDTFRQFLDQQSVFVVFVTIYVGAGLIADDRQANALQIYLSKPLTRVDYIGGKLVTLVTFLLGVTWLPAMMLLLFQLLLAGNTRFLRDHIFLVPAMTAFCAVQALVSGMAMLALSSLSTSRRFVAVLYAGIIFFCGAMYQTLRGITGRRGWAWISPEETFDTLADILFGISSTRSVSGPVVAVIIVGVVAGSIGILERRVRAVEIVT